MEPLCGRGVQECSLSALKHDSWIGFLFAIKYHRYPLDP